MACLGKKRQHLAPKPNSSFFNGFSARPFKTLRMSFYSLERKGSPKDNELVIAY